MDLVEAIIEAMSEGCVLVRDGVVIAVNDALCAMTGFTREELTGAPAPPIFCPPPTLTRFAAALDHVRHDGALSIRLPLVRHDGTRFPAELALREASSSSGPLAASSAREEVTIALIVRDLSVRSDRGLLPAVVPGRDRLTGLPDHRALHDRLGAELARAARYERSLSLAVIDVDRLSEVNRRHGEAVGDQVLAEVGRRLVELAREDELVARVRGGEFAWILFAAEGMGAYAAAERARRALIAAPVGRVGTITLSIGVCDLDHAIAPDELYACAAKALGWAKSHGRDRTFRYSLHTAEQLTALEPPAPAPGGALGALLALALTAEERHPRYAAHGRRVADLAERLASCAGWSETRAFALHRAALLHDIGQIAITPAIIAKPGPLSADELVQVRTHASVGAELIAPAVSREQAAWVRHHHERWDGDGYPAGLAGAAIPEGAQYLAVADAFDAMTHERPQRAAVSPRVALEEIRACAGRQFAPAAVELLQRVLEESSRQPR